MTVMCHKFLIVLEAQIFMVIVQRRKLLPTPTFSFTPVCCSPCLRYSWIFHLKWQLVFCTVSAPTLILIYNQNFPSKKKYEEAESFQIWTAEEKKRLCPFSSFLYMKKVCTCFQNCSQVHRLLLFFTLETWPTAGKRETLSTQRQRVKFNFRKEEY